jgi:hypothetical protein
MNGRVLDRAERVTVVLQRLSDRGRKANHSPRRLERR